MRSFSSSSLNLSTSFPVKKGLNPSLSISVLVVIPSRYKVNHRDKYSHSLVRHDSVRPARLEVPLNLTSRVDLHTAEYVFWPVIRCQRGACSRPNHSACIHYLHKGERDLPCYPPEIRRVSPLFRHVSARNHYHYHPSLQKAVREISVETQTHITEMHPTPSTTTPGPALITRPAGAAPAARAPAPQRAAAGARKRLRRRAQVRVRGGVRREHLVEHGEEPRVLAEGARRRREARRRTHGEVGVGRVRGEVGEEVRCRRGEGVGEDFLGRAKRALVSWWLIR